MVADLSGFSYFIPIFGFLLVFVVTYALLKKLEILGDSEFVLLLTSFVIGIIFVSMSSVQTLVTNVVPWFAVLIIVLFFIFVIIGFSQGKKFEGAPKWLMWVAVVVLIAIVLVSLVVVFSPVSVYLLPGTYSADSSNPALFFVRDFLYSQNVLGVILLLIIAVVTAWVLTRGKK